VTSLALKASFYFCPTTKWVARNDKPAKFCNDYDRNHNSWMIMSVIGTHYTIIITLPTALSHMYIIVIESPIQIRASSWRPERVMTLYRFSLSPIISFVSLVHWTQILSCSWRRCIIHSSMVLRFVRYEDRFLIGLKIVEDCCHDKNYFYFSLNDYIFL